MTHYQIMVQAQFMPNHVDEVFDLCETFGVEVSETLRDQDWGGGGGVFRDESLVTICLYAKGDHLSEAMGEVQNGMANYPLNWLTPSVKSLPDNARFERVLRNQWLCTDCETVEQFILTHQLHALMLKQWLEDGVRLDPASDIKGDSAVFVTDDYDVALKYCFVLVENDEDEAAELEEATSSAPPIME